MSGWFIGWCKSSSMGTSDPLPEGTVVPAGSYVVVDVDLDLGNVSSGADGAYLLCPDESILDAVVYGDPDNPEGVPDETGEPATSVSEEPAEGEVRARCPDAADTDASGEDLRVLGEKWATPGEANVCPVSGSRADEVQLVINEIVVNPDGSDGGHEWVEIYNAGSSDAVLSEWVVRSYKSADSPKDYEIPQGIELYAGAWLLVAGADADVEGDVELDVDFGNGSGGDGAHLVDPYGVVEDAVVYGKCKEAWIDVSDDYLAFGRGRYGWARVGWTLPAGVGVEGRVKRSRDWPSDALGDDYVSVVGQVRVATPWKVKLQGRYERVMPAEDEPESWFKLGADWRR